MSNKAAGSWRVKPNRQSALQGANITYRVREDAAKDALDLLPLSVKSLGAFGLLFLEQFMPWYEQSLIANMV